jgi:SAM-dependent methyltransferase
LSDTEPAELEPGSTEYQELNRAWWDERVPIHAGSGFYDLEGFVAGRDTLQPLEVQALGDVAGLDLVHLQCHLGLDTLSWARRGARVTGLDFSAPAIEVATDLATRIGADDARFVVADVYDAVEVLSQDYDVVYQSLGSLNWHPDLVRWASVVDALLRPGGRYFLLESHPMSWVLDDAGEHVEHGYFFDPAGDRWDDAGTYADLSAETEANASLEFRHPMSDVIRALLGAGLALERFDEHPYTVHEQWPWLEERGHRTWWAPEGRHAMPLMYSLLARKPG